MSARPRFLQTGSCGSCWAQAGSSNSESNEPGPVFIQCALVQRLDQVEALDYLLKTLAQLTVFLGELLVAVPNRIDGATLQMGTGLVVRAGLPVELVVMGSGFCHRLSGQSQGRRSSCHRRHRAKR